jgi:hypothetical protein
VTNKEKAYQAMMVALRSVLEANDDFRRGMPDGWEGDPLQDACIEARKALEFGERHALS